MGDPISGPGPTMPPSLPPEDDGPDGVTTPSPQVQDTLEAAEEQAPPEQAPNLYNLQPGRVNINDFYRLIRGNLSDFKADLHEIEFLESDMSRRIAQDAVEQIGRLIAFYNGAMAQLITNQIRQEFLDPLAATLNGSASQINGHISNHASATNQLNQAVQQYNTAVAIFNAQNAAGFGSPAERNAAIAAYNAAVAQYNAAVNSYNASAAFTNGQINNYNSLINAYNLQIDLANAEIEAINAQREAQGITPPLPLKEHYGGQFAPPVPIQPSVNPLPFADIPFVIPPAPTVAPPGNIIVGSVPVPSLFSFHTIVQDEFVTAMNVTLSYTTTFQRFFDFLLEERVLPFYFDQGVMDITEPDAPTYDRPEGQQVEGGSLGGTGVASLALGIDGDEMERILSNGLIKEAFEQLQMEPPFQLPDKLQALTFAFVLQNALRGTLPGISFLGNDITSVTTEGPAVRLALALGAVSGVLGIVRSNDLQNQVGPLVDELAGFEKLSAEEKQRLSKDLSAVITNKILQLSVALLANETGNKALLNVLQAGLITGAPLAEADARFALVTNAFSQLFTNFGADTVIGVTEEAVGEGLTAQGFSAEQAARLAGLVATSLAEEGIPDTASQLTAQVQAALAAAIGEEAATDVLAREVANTIITVGVAGQVRESLVSALVPEVGPKLAFSLTEEVSLRLFGLSSDFSEGAIVTRAEEEKSALSLVRALKEHTEVLYEREDSKLGAMLAEEFDDASASVQDLGALLREIIDPGQLFFGVMYEGAKGTAFERGESDIRL